jgi:kumamolisin
MPTSLGLRSCAAGCAAVVACLVGFLSGGSASAAVHPLGAASGGRSLSLVLPLQANEAGLERLAAAVSTPGSPRYGEFQPLASLSQRYGASPSTRRRVLRWLQGAGATRVRIDATGLFADATLSAGKAQRLFGTSLARFHSARQGNFIAPAATPRVPAKLQGAVEGVVGLDTQPIFGRGQSQMATSNFVREAPATSRFAHEAPRAAPATAGAVSPAGQGSRAGGDAQATSANLVSGYPHRSGTPAGCGGAVSGGGFTPNQYLSAYGLSPLHKAGIQGQGERVALIEIDGFRYSDLRNFAGCFGLGVPAINGYGVGIGKPLAPGGESTLDLEVLDAAAPRLREIDVYESHPRAADVLRSLTAPLQNPGRIPQVISASLGTCEPALVESIGYPGVRAVEGALAAAAASGITVLASSGDDGSTACLNRSGPIDLLSVSFPASSPLVTGVGGTNVQLNPDNSIASQVVWNDGPDDLAAGGGGVSGLFMRPSYQKGFVSPNRRVVPDVSLLADVLPGYEIYCSVNECRDPNRPGNWVAVGGTSASAPLLAGGMALTDQVLRLRRRQELGLANMLLYPLAHSSSAPSVFSDVTLSDNDLSPYLDTHKTLGCCHAGPGFDYASGLGSVNIAAFASVASLLQPPIASVGLSLPRQSRPISRKHLLATVSCSRKCVAYAYARIAVGKARPFRVRSTSVVFRGRDHRTLRLALSAANVRRIRNGLGAHKAVAAAVFAAVTDSGGNVLGTSQSRALRLRG